MLCTKECKFIVQGGEKLCRKAKMSMLLNCDSRSPVSGSRRWPSVLVRPHRASQETVNCKVKPQWGAQLQSQMLRTLTNRSNVQKSTGALSPRELWQIVGDQAGFGLEHRGLAENIWSLSGRGFPFSVCFWGQNKARERKVDEHKV